MPVAPPCLPVPPALPAVPGPSDERAARPVTVRLRSRLAATALAALSVGAVLAGPAASAEPTPRPYVLTSAQERTVLRLVDDVCADTWCEGDHALRFTRFSCQPRRASCTLRLRVASWAPEPLRWCSRSQPITGFPRFRDMVATAPDGERSLQPPFYEAVGEAVRAAVATVP